MSTTEHPTPVYATSLATAKEGETVMQYHYGEHSPQVITRTTATIIEIGAFQYNRKGRERGRPYSRERIRITAPEEVADLAAEKERLKRRRRVCDMDWRTLTTKQTQAVCDLLDSFKND